MLNVATNNEDTIVLEVSCYGMRVQNITKRVTEICYRMGNINNQVERWGCYGVRITLDNQAG